MSILASDRDGNIAEYVMTDNPDDVFGLNTSTYDVCPLWPQIQTRISQSMSCQTDNPDDLLGMNILTGKTEYKSDF